MKTGIKLWKYWDDLYLLRNNIKSFIYEDILPAVESGTSLLEIGPMILDNMKYKNMFVDTRKLFTEKGVNYKCNDIFNHPNIDYIGNILNCDSFIKETFGTILILDVIEHVKEVWTIPEKLYKLLNKNGKLFVSTPFYFRIHGIDQDCWRFTETGLRDLFEKHFDIESITPLIKWNEKKPIHYSMIARKK